MKRIDKIMKDALLFSLFASLIHLFPVSLVASVHYWGYPTMLIFIFIWIPGFILTIPVAVLTKLHRKVADKKYLKALHYAVSIPLLLLLLFWSLNAIALYLHDLWPVRFDWLRSWVWLPI